MRLICHIEAIWLHFPVLLLFKPSNTDDNCIQAECYFHNWSNGFLVRFSWMHDNVPKMKNQNPLRFSLYKTILPRVSSRLTFRSAPSLTAFSKAVNKESHFLKVSCRTCICRYKSVQTIGCGISWNLLAWTFIILYLPFIFYRKNGFVLSPFLLLLFHSIIWFINCLFCRFLHCLCFLVPVLHLEVRLSTHHHFLLIIRSGAHLCLAKHFSEI